MGELYLQALFVYLVVAITVRVMGAGFGVVGSLYVALVIMSQVFAGRLGDYGVFAIPQGTATFTATMALMDIIVSRYGLIEARRVIIAGLVANALLMATPWLLIATPSVFPDEHWRMTVLTTGRIAFASVVAYLVSESVNAYLTHRFGRNIELKVLGSDPVALVLDTAIFVTVAFAWVLPLEALVAAVWGTVVAKLVLLPLNYMVLKINRRFIA